MIFTFYSFKGGVGRSMTVANLAELLYKRGLNVLMVDFDLEAPGLERYFETSEDLSEKRGVIDMVLSYKTLSSLLPRETTKQRQTLEEFSKSIEPLENFISPVYPQQNGGAGLSLITAGRRPKDDYKQFSESVSRLDWDDLYVSFNGGMFFDWLRRETSRYFDVVLIDSRTGITEMTGICTYHLADAVVMFVAPNKQNLDGTLLIANGLRKRESEDGAKRDRKLELLIIPSRVDISESPSVGDFKTSFIDSMLPFLNQSLLFENSAFDDLKIPYIPRYAFYEKVAAREPEHPVAADMVGAYGRILAAMVEIANKNSSFYRRYFFTTHSASIIAKNSWTPKAPENFVERFWVLNAIDDWLASTGSTFLIQGEPGSGKSALAFRLVQISRGEVEISEWPRITPGLLVYAHFCTAVNVHSYDPASFLTSLTMALANRYPAFAAALAQTRETDVRIQVRQSIGANALGTPIPGVKIESLELVNPDVTRGLSHLVIEPLAKLYSEGFSETPVVLIDGLDVANDCVPENNILTLVSLIVRRLPEVRFILTSRPDPRVMAELLGTDTIDLTSRSEHLNDDLRPYLEKRLEAYPRDKRTELVRKILNAAKGNFLYAEFAAAELKAGSTKDFDPAKIPTGMLGFYRDDVAKKVGNDLQRWKTRDGLFLGLLAVQKGDGLLKGDGLPPSRLAGILGWSETEMAAVIQDWRQYLTGDWSRAPLHFFHDSFRQFLLTNTEFPVSLPQSHQLIGDYFIKTFGTDWSLCEDNYALHYTSAHLMDAFNAATDPQERDTILDKLTTVLSDPDFLAKRGALIGLAELAEELEAAPPSPGILGNLADLYNQLDRGSDAVATYERALKLAQSEGDQRLANALMGNLGLTLANRDEWEKAIKIYNEAVTLARAIGDVQSESIHLGNLGWAYYSVGQIDSAIESLSRALQFSRDLRLKAHELRLLTNLGYLYVAQDQIEKGIQLYTEALAIARTLEDLGTCVVVLRALGIAHQSLERLPEAAENFDQAAAIMEQLGDRDGLLWISTRRANLYLIQGDVEQAMTSYSRSLELAQELGDRGTEGNIWNHLGNVFEAAGHTEYAEEYYERALEKFQELGNTQREITITEKLRTIRSGLGQSHVTVEDDVKKGDLSRDTILGSESHLRKGASSSMAQTIRRSELDELLLPTEQVLRDDPSIPDDAWGTFLLLKAELAKGNHADDRLLARTTDKLISQVPAVGEVLADLLTSPRLGNIVGPVTQFVIEKFLESSSADNQKQASS